MTVPYLRFVKEGDERRRRELGGAVRYGVGRCLGRVLCPCLPQNFFKFLVQSEIFGSKIFCIQVKEGEHSAVPLPKIRLCAMTK